MQKLKEYLLGAGETGEGKKAMFIFCRRDVKTF